MARALYPEEESALDYKIVELSASQRKRLSCNFFAVVFAVLLLLALGCTLLLQKTAVPVASGRNNQSVTPTVAIVQVQDHTAGNITSTVVDDVNIKEWESYLRFEQAAPLEPVMPALNTFYVQRSLESHGNVSLYYELHPNDHCLLILSREALRKDELTDSTKIRNCFGRLERNFRATHELYDHDLGFLLDLCADLPLVPVMQKSCETRS